MTVLAPERPMPAPAMGDSRETDQAQRLAPLAVSAVVIFYSFLQAPGRIVADTKLDLYVAPGEFLRRALHLWDSQAGFGQIQNQAPGYLFPMGPFFAIAHALHVPAWVAQRLWISVLLLLAFWGTLKVAEALAIGTPWTRLVGAAAYALSPAMLGLIAVTSGNQLPAALLPWALLPLVRHAPSAKPSRTAARSALVVAAMGGINGMATIAVLVVPLIWLLTRPPGRTRRRLIAWWVPCVVLATGWWTGPLLLQGRYGFHFLDFTESAAVTTATSSIVETVRGTGNWVSYLHVNGPWLRGGWELVSSPLVILASAFLAAAGLYGLARRDLAERRFLALIAVAGILVVTAGYAGPLASPLAPAIQSLLRGALSPARNLNKFEPLLRLALALGLAHAICVIDMSSFVRRVGTAGLLVVIAAAPLWQGHLPPDGSFRALPSYWRGATRWLDDRAGRGRTLVVPSASFAEYTWGRPLDEPMQALAKSGWAVRDIVPLGSVGATRLLDTVERQLERGEPSSGLAPFLARAGIHYLLLRNDLDPRRNGAPAPAYMRRALDGSPGLVRVAAFGPHVDYVMGADRMVPDLGRSVRRDVRSLEVYELDSPPTVIASYPRSGAISTTGAPDALLQLSDAGALGGRAAVLAGDPLGGRTNDAVVAQSDAVQRRDEEFGWVRNSLSYPLTASERAPGTDDQPRERLVVGGAGAETTVRMTGAVALDASSYESALARAPEHQPYAAFDNNPDTAWITGSLDGTIGQWIQLRVGKAIAPHTVDVRLLLDHPSRPRITALRITTEAGSVTREVQATEAPQTLVLPPGKTAWIRLTIAAVQPAPLGGGGGAGLREVRVPGVEVDRTLALPRPAGTAASSGQEVLLTRAHADPYDLLRSDEEAGLERTFSLPVGTDLALSGTVRPVPGVDLDKRLDALVPASSLQIAPSSTWGGLPVFGARSLSDGDGTTSWLASPDDLQPSIQLSWPDIRTLDSIQVTAPDGPARRPLKVRLQSGLAVRDVDVASGDVMPFEPLRGSQITVTFLEAAPTAAGEKTPSFATPLAFGLAELRFPALDGLRAAAQPDAAVHLACGDGPTVVVDGMRVPTAVEGTVRDLQRLAPLKLLSCGTLRLPAGEHRFVAEPDDGLALTTAALLPPSSPPASQARQVTVKGRWNAESRAVGLGPGGASYLALTENFNRGWTATLDGRRLPPVRLDGWRQAWVVPAGSGGVVHLSFPPGHQYRWLLLGGAVGAVALLALALAPRRRLPASQPLEAAGPTGSSSIGHTLQVCAVGAAAFTLGGLLGLLIGAVLLLVPHRGRRLPAVAGTAFALAGVAVFLSPGRFPGSGSGAFGAPAQAFALLAVLAVAVSLVRARDAKG